MKNVSKNLEQVYYAEFVRKRSGSFDNYMLQGRCDETKKFFSKRI
jgi:hypothetical protein